MHKKCFKELRLYVFHIICECVILGKKITRNVTKWQVTNIDNKNQ